MRDRLFTVRSSLAERKSGGNCAFDVIVHVFTPPFIIFYTVTKTQ